MALDDEQKELIREVIREGAAEFRAQTQASLDELVLKAVSQILVGFGMQEDDQKEFRADLVYLRSWRKSVQQATNAGMIALFGIFISGLAGAIWLGIKSFILIGKG